jgi:hypothetical protein
MYSDEWVACTGDDINFCCRLTPARFLFQADSTKKLRKCMANARLTLHPDKISLDSGRIPTCGTLEFFIKKILPKAAVKLEF